MATQIPPLLESYLALPPETSQLVLTGVLGASTNWLVLRYLYSLLRPGAGAGTHDNNNNKVPAPHGGDGGGAAATGRGQPTVLLVSFMRDYAFWKDGAGRLVCFFCDFLTFEFDLRFFNHFRSPPPLHPLSDLTSSTC